MIAYIPQVYEPTAQRAAVRQALNRIAGKIEPTQVDSQELRGTGLRLRRHHHHHHLLRGLPALA